MTAARTARSKRATGAETAAQQAAEETPSDSAWETVFTGTGSPASNAGYELSGGAVSTAWKNAKPMIRQGYTFRPDGIFHWHGGCVTSPLGKCYDVYLPGAYPGCEEGRCSCPFFSLHHICKHIYFAVHQFQALPLPAAPAATKTIKAARPAPGF